MGNSEMCKDNTIETINHKNDYLHFSNFTQDWALINTMELNRFNSEDCEISKENSKNYGGKSNNLEELSEVIAEENKIVISDYEEEVWNKSKNITIVKSNI